MSRRTRLNAPLGQADGSGTYATLAVTGAGTKRVTMAIGASVIGSNNSITDWLPRVLLRPTMTTTRYRLRVKNPGQTGVVTVSDVYLGSPVRDSNGTFGGNATGLTKILSTFVTPSDGVAEYVSPWVTDPALQLSAGVEYVLTYGVTGSGGQVFAYTDGQGFIFYGSGAAAQVATGSPTSVSAVYALLLDVRLEFETLTTQPVGLIIADSFAVGQTDAGGKGDSASPWSTWPGLAGAMNRFLFVNASVSGYTYSSFTNTGASTYTRFDLATTVPDFAILACGYNEAIAGTTNASTKTSFASVVVALRALGIKRIFACTVPPKTSFKAGILTAGVASGVTTITTSVAYANADVITIGIDSVNAETRTVSGASTGTGPYTTTVTVATSNAHALNEHVGLNGEVLRQGWNSILRGLPSGIEGVFDVATALEDPSNPGAPLYKYYLGTANHLPVQGYEQMATAIRFEHRV